MIKTKNAESLEGYPFFKLSVNFNPENPEDFEKSVCDFKEALAALSKTEIGAFVLKKCQEDYEKNGQPKHINVWSQGCAFLRRDELNGAYGIFHPNKDFDSIGKERETPDIEVMSGNNEPKLMAMTFLHELVHMRHLENIFPKIFQKDKPLNVHDVLMYFYVDEIFAQSSEEACSYEPYGISRNNVLNYLSMCIPGFSGMTQKELGKKTALTFAKLCINQVEAQNASKELPNILPNYLFKAMHVLSAQQEEYQRFFIAPLRIAGRFLANLDTPVEQMSFDRSNVQNVFNIFLKSDFPTLYDEHASDFKAEKRSRVFYEDMKCFDYSDFSDEESNKFLQIMSVCESQDQNSSGTFPPISLNGMQGQKRHLERG